MGFQGRGAEEMVVGGVQLSALSPICRNEKLICIEITRLICLTPIIFAITRIHRV